MGYLPAANSPVGHARLFLYLILGNTLLQQLLDLAACLFGVCFACNNASDQQACLVPRRGHGYAPILLTAMPMSLSLALSFKVTESMGSALPARLSSAHPRDASASRAPLSLHFKSNGSQSRLKHLLLLLTIE